MTSYKINLRRQLRGLCEDSSQAEVAKKLNTTQSRVSRLLSGDATFNIDELIKLGEEKGVSIDTLLYGKPDAQLIETMKTVILTRSKDLVKVLSKEEKKVLLNALVDSFSS